MKKLYILRKVKNILKEKTNLEISKYKDFILSAKTLESIEKLPEIGIKSIVLDNQIQREGNIYKIQESAGKEEFVIMYGDYILPFSLLKKRTEKKLTEKEKKDIHQKYVKYKPLSKKEIFNIIYMGAEDNGKKLLTKKFLNENKIEVIREKLSYHDIDTLENFLMYYSVRKSKSIKIKKLEPEKEKDLIEGSNYYKSLQKIANDSSLSALEKIYELKKIEKLIEDEIESIEQNITLEETPEGLDGYFDIIEKEELIFDKDFPNDKELLSKFFKKEFDEKKYKYEIENGEEKRYSIETSVVVNKPCLGVNEFLLNKSLENFAKRFRHEMRDFSTNDRIEMIA